MEILILEPLVPDALAWLQARHEVEYRPQLADDPQAMAGALPAARAVVLPRQIAVTREWLQNAPALKAVARLHEGTDNIDLEACLAQGVKVLQATRAHVRSNAEFLLGALLMLMRRGMGPALAGHPQASLRMGREMQGSTIGLLGLSPTAQSLAALLRAMGVHLTGYDPAIHYSSPLWANLQIRPVTLPELMAGADAISVQMHFASRYRGFINEQTLATCKPRQLWVSTCRSHLFEARALARALTDGRIEACLIDGAETGFAAQGTPLHGLDNLHLTPRMGSNTREARTRASWYLAHHLHDALQPRPAAARLDDSGSDAVMSTPVVPFDEVSWAGARSPAI
jgi:phosphoglycerate dehydrogenase-like enzyme